ncbi:substrate-binding domain-containing protein [Microbacterium oryzae]|uniref:substrate-binding domain-containing protein n=1 Tax=Microbacterium oryzae TaxID=743009 RepID=UPI0025B16098|nr:substrate-binding domain-containing protein [Microbacterium oryzae]MDN3310232.1 substrate-binding domain-containing protein [Microbacterium oryzae]
MRAITSMATRHVLTELAAAVAAEGLPALQLESVGGVTAADRVRAGEPWDLVFLAVDALERLGADGHVIADTVTPMLVSSVAVAVAVPSATTEPAADPATAAYPDAGAVRTAVAAAGRIGYSSGPSGTALLRHFEDWGLRAALEGRLVQAPPGVPVARMLADGEVDMGFQQLSELVAQPGIRLLGTLPPDCAITTVFGGAVAATAAEPARARDVLRYLASDAAAPAALRHSFARPGQDSEGVRGS